MQEKFTIKLDQVSKTYVGSFEPAVNNISLAVEKGSIITLLGPSGCGKSTTLRLIAGFECPDNGVITLGDQVVSDNNYWVPPERRGVGMVFQDYALFPHLNVFDNIGFGYKAKDRLSRIREVINLVGLQGFENRYPHELSGGQQQRVALARALAPRPVVVLLDEPFSNLDADMRANMRNEVKKIIKEAQATAIFVSHDQLDAFAISDEIIVMNKGTIQQRGTPREIYQFPENKFVAEFVGQTNILKGKIAEDGLFVETELGQIPYPHKYNLNLDGEVYISIRPESLELDDNGPFEGILKESIYRGETIDALVEVQFTNGKKELLMHIHPEKVVNIGEQVRFKILQDFVAIICNNQQSINEC
ncbi:ABC transporter ATP-binding protein [Natranaerobius thermophilus]|uniref:ABC-type quaternary amine transporter n=1 Tax=Natranaerobius thermophilus (strain ATCC BAA-1301 / DSM 18059 / JW/NM-WN-LF) TaxID=457570 RepID=B2A3K6_NATTJ|nr:ABC transporter ATP-binding protein [Natranaerobius thermophilus]ACB86435.1 ABC transporter related [Natranaerobius thermophilus JW/NM-WN-LF]